MIPALLLALALQQVDAPAPPAPPAAPAAPAAPAPARKRPARPAAERAPAAGAQAAEAPAPGEEPVLRGFDRPSGKRFTGDFDEEDVADALREIADAADWSLVLPGGRLGEVTAHLRNAPVEDALAAVLAQADLVASRQGTVVTVRPRAGAPGRGPARRGASAEAEEGGPGPGRPERPGREGRRGSNDKVVHGDVVVHAGKPVRDVVALRGSVRVEAGAEVRDAVAILGSVVLEPGARARQAVAVGGSVRLAEGAQVEKDAVAVAGEVVRAEGAEVGGEEVGIGIPVLTGLAAGLGTGALAGHELSSSPALKVGVVLAKLLVYFVVALLTFVLFPRRLDAVTASFTSHPWKAVLAGLLGVLAIPVTAVLLAVTIVGIPLVAVLAVLVVAAGALGFAAIAWWVGRMLPPPVSRASAVLQLAAGTAIVVVLTSVPFLGGMVWVAAALLGFGAVLRSRFGSEPGPLPTIAAPPPQAPPPAAS